MSMATRLYETLCEPLQYAMLQHARHEYEPKWLTIYLYFLLLRLIFYFMFLDSI